MHREAVEGESVTVAGPRILATCECEPGRQAPPPPNLEVRSFHRSP